MNACAYHPSEPAIGSCGECFRGICEACVRDRGRNLCAACIRGRRRTRTVLLALVGIVAVAGGVWESAMMARYGAQTEHILTLQEQLRRERCNSAAALELAERLLAAGVAREVPALVATYSAQCGRNEELVEKNYAAARRIGEWQRAIAVATDLIEHNPADPNYWWWRGIIYEEHEQLDQALADYKQTLGIRPDFSSIPINVADIYERMRRPCDAALTLEQVLHFHPRAREDPGIKLRLARLYRQGHCEEAARGTAHVRFAGQGGAIVVTASVNGQPGRFVIDTGANLVALRRDFAGRAGISARTAGPPIRIQTANGVGLARLIRLDSLALQGASADSVEAVMIDSLPGDIDGLLGLSFLSRFEFRLDAEAGQLHLTSKRR